nr:MAG TPA: hypothetical protein [Bacteriophage sp.]
MRVLRLLNRKVSLPQQTLHQMLFGQQMAQSLI